MTMNMNNDYDTAPGFGRLRVGDIVIIGGLSYIVEMKNQSRDRCLPLNSKGTDIELEGDNLKVTTKRFASISIATSVERGTILERRGEQGLKNFLASKGKRGAATTETSNESQDMKKEKKPKTENKWARGGLAAAAMEANEKRGTKPKAERKPRTPKNNWNGEHKKPAKTFIEKLLNGGKTTREEAVALVMADYGVTEKAAKGAVGNARHYQKKEGRPVGEWKKAEKATAAATTA